MEFPNLGANCQHPQCNALDFLPFNCAYCNAVFCQNHFQPAVHKCPNVTEKLTDGKSAKKNPVCTMEGCGVKDVVEMNCIKCHRHYCLTHRYHNCFAFSEAEIEEARKKILDNRAIFAKSLEKVSNQININIEKSKKSDKNRAMALKVQLMRLKGKAVGSTSVPAPERLYLLIYLPLQCEQKSKAVFISNTWSVGRVIDSIAALCDVANRNNDARADKLRLFWKVDGRQLSRDMSVKMSELVRDDQNGESFILEYVNAQNLESFDISDPNLYNE